jgi:hypothetical protein
VQPASSSASAKHGEMSERAYLGEGEGQPWHGTAAPLQPGRVNFDERERVANWLSVTVAMRAPGRPFDCITAVKELRTILRFP